MKPIVHIFNVEVKTFLGVSRLSGRVKGHPNIRDGHKIISSPILKVSAEACEYETENTIYQEIKTTEVESLILGLLDEIIEKIGGI